VPDVIQPPTPPQSEPAPQDSAPKTTLEKMGAVAADLGSGDHISPRAKRLIGFGLVILIFAFLIGFIVSQASKLPDYDWQFEPGWLLLAALGASAMLVGQGECWAVILRSLGGQIDGTPRRAVYAKSLVARYVPTSVLMVVGRVVLAEKYGVPRRVSLASIVYEAGIAVCSAVLVGAYFVITMPRLEDQPARYAILVIVPLALAVLHPRVFEPIANRVLRKLGREPLPRVLGFGRVLEIMGLYLLTWLAIGCAVFAFASALHPVDASDFPYIAASYPVAFCVAVLTFIVPSGLGTRDAALATALSAVMPAAVATAIAVAFRLLQVALEMVYVAVTTGLGSAYDRRHPIEEEAAA
jgi:glycosyltransferase 2 family protein